MAAAQELLDADQVAALLGKHRNTVLKHARDGELAAIRFGHRTVRFDPVDVQRFIDARRIPAFALEDVAAAIEREAERIREGGEAVATRRPQDQDGTTDLES